MKRKLSLILAFALLASLLTGCGSAAPTAQDNGKLKIVTTIFPVYDWIVNILGDRAENAEVTMLLDNGVDLHSYQPTADDMVKISSCDLFVYVGGESDAWVEDALREAVNKDMVVVDLLEALGDAAKVEELVEGMEEEEDEGDEGDEEEPEYDEHVWLSLSNAAALCPVIENALESIDPESGAVYKANTAAYIEKLNKLDVSYREAVEAAGVKTLLFGDRFPFRYLADDYALGYYAALTGCSAETEASFETIVFLANKVDELGLHSILQIESADGSIARTIRDNTQNKNQEILTLDSMQSTTSRDVAGGASYLGIMEKNLAVLKAALG